MVRPGLVNCSASAPLDVNTAPAAGIEPDGADGNKICGMNIHLVRKPQGGRVVREFSDSENLAADASWGPGFLYAAAMLGIRTVGKTDRYVWTDRYLRHARLPRRAEWSRRVEYLFRRRRAEEHGVSRPRRRRRRYLQPRRHRDAEGP